MEFEETNDYIFEECWLYLSKLTTETSNRCIFCLKRPHRSGSVGVGKIGYADVLE